MTTLVRNKPLQSDFLEGFWDRGGVDEYTGTPNSPGHRRTRHPAVNIYQHDSGYDIELFVPGYDKSDLDIRIENNMLTVRGDVPEKAGERKVYSLQEYQTSPFERNFHLPADAREDEINARYLNGMLHIMIPSDNKKSEAGSKNIAIS